MQIAATLCGRASRIARTAPVLAAIFSLVFALLLLAPTAKPAAARSKADLNERYLSPLEMLLSPDGRLLYVVCQGSDELRVADADSGKVVTVVPLGRAPRGIVLAA